MKDKRIQTKPMPAQQVWALKMEAERHGKSLRDYVTTILSTKAEKLILKQQ